MTVPYTFATQSGNVPASELDANFASVANNVSSANTALTAGTVTTNAQPNITSVVVGALTLATCFWLMFYSHRDHIEEGISS